MIGGRTYQLTVDVAEATSGSIKIDGGGISQQVFNTAGINTRIISPTSNTNVKFYRASANVDITLNSVSVKEITDDTNIPRINYEGFSYQDSLGSELVTNGDFATDSDWTAVNSGGWTISGGSANSDGTSSASAIYQQNILVVGKTYKITFTTIITSGTVAVSAGFSGTGTSRTVSGTYTEILTAATNDELYIKGTSNFIGSIDNVSVKEVTGQEVVPNSGCGSWLLEPQSTNLLLQSNQFDTTWAKSSGVTITSEQTISPQGTNNGWKFEKTAVAYKSIGQNYTSSSETTFSIFAKKGTLSVITLFANINGGSNLYQRFDLENGIASTGSGMSSSNIKDYGNGWYRCSSTFTNTNVISLDYFPDFGETEAGYIYIWGAQAEAQSYATSYVPTSGATSTRLQDIATNSGNSTLINSTEGVLYADIAALDSSNIFDFGIYGNTTTNQCRIGFFNNDVYASLFNGSFQTQMSAASDLLNFTKIAFKFKQNDFSLWINGNEVATDTSGTTFNTGDLVKLNLSAQNGTSSLVTGKVKALAVYKEALTDANLRSLTYPPAVATTFNLDFNTIANDFTFTRGSEATFVNAQGLIESTNQIGSELVTNGDFATDSNWSKGGGWSISGGKAEALNVNGSYLVQNISFTNAKTYKIQFSVSDYLSGEVRIRFSGGGGFISTDYVSGNNTHTLYLQSIGNTVFRLQGQNNFTGSIDNVSVKEVISATNTPRIDYSTGAKAFLLEPQSTNLITYSDNFDGTNGVINHSNNYWI